MKHVRDGAEAALLLPLMDLVVGPFVSSWRGFGAIRESILLEHCSFPPRPAACEREEVFRATFGRCGAARGGTASLLRSASAVPRTE